jgi:hypothetical protein
MIYRDAISNFQKEDQLPSALKDILMKTPEWLSPGLYGAACGAIALGIVGFTWGGWVTGGTAQKMATEQASKDVVTALTPVCLDQAKRDPQLVERTAAIKAGSSWSRGDMVAKNGWATPPGGTEPNRQVANACAEKIPV